MELRLIGEASRSRGSAIHVWAEMSARPLCGDHGLTRSTPDLLTLSRLEWLPSD